MGVEAQEHLCDNAAEPIEHREHNDQRGYTNSDSNNRDQHDNVDESQLTSGAKVAARYEMLISHKLHKPQSIHRMKLGRKPRRDNRAQ